MESMGGTELLYNNLTNRINLNDYNINLIKSTCHMDFLKSDKKNVLWQHLSYDQPFVQQMQSTNFTNAVDAFVYVSHWQYQRFQQIFKHPFQKGHVIKNAIDPIEYKPKDKDGKLKLIYTSTPWRGLDVLLEVWKNLNRNDVELHVYSSTKIYGSGFEASDDAKEWEPLLEHTANTKGVTYHGYATNDKVRKALQEAHIFTYPSTFEETSCLSMIEAGAAGLSLVSTNLGALPETGSEFATLVELPRTKEDLVINYTKILNEEIDSFWTKQDKLKQQSDFYNEYYSWNNRIKDWEKLFNSLSKGNK
jgi:glycosyltransferase involved in cell wall biosynthesis